MYALYERKYMTTINNYGISYNTTAIPLNTYTDKNSNNKNRDQFAELSSLKQNLFLPSQNNQSEKYLKTDHRFARNYTVEEIFNDHVKAEKFENEYLKQEGRFFAISRDTVTGLTYDGYNLETKTGKPEKVRNFSAPSKECLDIAILIKAVSGNKKASLVVSPEEPDKAEIKAVEILEKKINSYDKFQKDNPGYAGYMPWFNHDKKITPNNDWKDQFPGLDNGEWIWSLKTAEHVLKKKGYNELSDRYKKYNDNIANNISNIFYDRQEGKVKADIKFEKNTNGEFSYYPAPNKAPNLSGEHGVHEGMMLNLYVSLFGKNISEDDIKTIWDQIDLKRVEDKYGTTWNGYWGSAHESWAYLILPLRDIPEYKDLFRIREKIRTNYANEKNYPGLATSSLINKDQYFSDAGIPEISTQKVNHNDTFAVYGAYPLLLEFSEKENRSGNYGLAWLENMILADKMQGPLGAGEAGYNDARAFSDVKTIDGSFTNVIAMSGGLENETADMLKDEGKYESFKNILKYKYISSFGNKELNEPVDFAMPPDKVPESIHGDYK